MKLMSEVNIEVSYAELPQFVFISMTTLGNYFKFFIKDFIFVAF